METNRQRAEELLCKKSKISIGCLVADYKQKCITPEIAIDAMLEFRNEGLREELEGVADFIFEKALHINYTKERTKEFVEAYLKTKQ